MRQQNQEYHILYAIRINYGSVLRSFTDMTMVRTTDGRRTGWRRQP